MGLHAPNEEVILGNRTQRRRFEKVWLFEVEGGEEVKTTSFAPLAGETWAQLTPNYLLSNHGRWYSVNTNSLLKQRPNSAGYMRVYAYMDGRKDIFTHIKVVEAFGDCKGKRVPYGGSLVEHGLSIDHLDGNKLNNAQSNLEIVSHIENCARRDQRRVARTTSYVEPDADLDLMWEVAR